MVALATVVLLHIMVYQSVIRLAALRPAAAFLDPATWLDARIPHMPATWPLYWLPYALVPLGGGLAALRLSGASFRRLILVWAVMIIAAGGIQVAFPAEAPWPVNPAPAQRAFHDSAWIGPYATLPSMHVAHTALAGAVVCSVFVSSAVRSAAVVTTALVTLSTLTLKEHVVLDAVSGLLLAGMAWILWRGGAHRAA